MTMPIDRETTAPDPLEAGTNSRLARTPMPRGRPRPTSGKRLVLGVLAASTLVAFVVVFWLSSKYQQTIVGKTDPQTGLRASFKISSHWRPEPAESGIAMSFGDFSTNTIDRQYYAPGPPAGWLAWLDTHLLHRPKTTSHAYSPVLYFETLQGVQNSFFALDNGDPVVSAKDLATLRVTRNEKQTLSGQPSLYFEVESPRSLPSNPYIRKYLIVKVREKPLWFVVGGSCAINDQAPLQAEMDNVIRSFRIEQAAVPTRP